MAGHVASSLAGSRERGMLLLRSLFLFLASVAPAHRTVPLTFRMGSLTRSPRSPRSGLSLTGMSRGLSRLIITGFPASSYVPFLAMGTLAPGEPRSPFQSGVRKAQLFRQKLPSPPPQCSTERFCGLQHGDLDFIGVVRLESLSSVKSLHCLSALTKCLSLYSVAPPVLPRSPKHRASC